MEKTTTKKITTKKNQTFREPTDLDKFEQSRQAALACLEQYPQAQIVYRKTKDSKAPWKNPQYHLTHKQILTYNARRGFFAIILKSLNLCVIDFDIKSKAHPEGIEPEALKKTIKVWNLENYPFQQRTQSGGIHCLFKNPPEKLKGDSNKFGTGIDYLVGTKLLCLYQSALWKHNLKDLRTVPDLAIQTLKNKKKALNGKTPPSGHGQTNKLLNSGFGTFANARTPFQLGQKCFEIIEAYKANPGKTGRDEAILKIGKSLADGLSQNTTLQVNPVVTKASEVILHEKEKIHDINWAIEDWFEFGELSLIGGDPGSGKTTLAIKLAVLNAQKRPFWEGGPTGDGRKSLYICFERKGSKAHNKELACGGDGEQLDIIKELKINGKTTPIDLENPQHLKIILKMIKTNNYFSVILDPVVDLVLSNQNDNAQVRKQVAILLRETHKMNTAFFGIAHLRKQRTGINDLGGFRGASELVNISTSVCRVFEMKDGEGFILGKLKVNESKVGKKGGIQYKIETLDINKVFLAEGSKETGKGGIRELKFLNKPLSELKKSCVKELDFKESESPVETINKVILRLRAENKELNTAIIKNLAKAEGVSAYFLNKKLVWDDFGYISQSVGQGGNQRNILRQKADLPHNTLKA